jgi:[acyl-carrier-protein] S-malonyltransferase
MGVDLIDAFESARATYEEADDILDWSVADLCANGPSEKLNDTRFTQPALFVHSVAAGRVLLEAGIKPDYVAGHSLGEYSALAIAGAFSFADGLRLVVARALAMADAGTDSSGTMAAIIGLDSEAVNSVLKDIDGVVPANFNAPDQIVISGTTAGVEAASSALANAGAKRVVALSVSGAFHSPLMQAAQGALESAVNAVDIRAPRVPVVANVTATATDEPARIRDLLIRQITSPVRWTESVQALAKIGVTLGYEVGPGKVLQGLARRIDRALKVVGAGTVEDLQAARLASSV